MSTQPDPEDHIEVEWQFSAGDVRAVARWLTYASIPGYTVTAGDTRDLHDTYFDTPDWRLHRGGFTCRIREKRPGTELTLKSMADAAGSMRSRHEINEPLPPGARSPSAATGPCARIIRALAGSGPIEALFTLHTERRIFVLSNEAGPLAEISIDVTTIPAGEDVPIRLSRVEVEVDAPDIDRARPFVDILRRATNLSPATTSKFESGLIATGREIPALPSDCGIRK